MKASFKTVDITPPIGMQMAGYSERTHGTTGIHDPILVQAFVIDDGHDKIAYAMCDVVGIDLYATNKVRSIINKATKIPKENIMIGAIHTHSSVFACRLNGQNFLPIIQFDEESDNAYYQQFIQKIAGAVIWANDTLQDAKIGLGITHLDELGTNRNDPKAYYDNQVSVIRVDDPDNNLVGAIIHHACHPTVLNQDNYLISADFVGSMRMQLNQAIPNTTFMYSQGAAGSASTRFTKKNSSFEEADRLASFLSKKVLSILPNIETTSEINVSSKTEKLILNIKDFPSDEECIQQIEKYKENLKHLEDTNSSLQEIRKAYVTLQGAERNFIKKKNLTIHSLETEMQCLDFGEFKIIGIPADCFGEISRDIKNLISDKHVLVAGYTNDFVSYILSKEGYAMDCYEKNMTIVTEKAHDEIVRIANILIEKQSN
ncbi:MAG: neutral/alkaline non-lysosomal ceramidase N-terminal domain-containing protein [Anaerorhabdus sp.]